MATSNGATLLASLCVWAVARCRCHSPLHIPSPLHGGGNLARCTATVPQPCAAIRPSATAAGEISAYTWSRYLESVYGEPLGDASVVEAHLASANFFYYAFYPMPECVVEWQYGDTLAPNVAWRAASILTPSRHASPPDGAAFLRADGTDGLLGCMPNCPESVVGRVGFFVNRETEPSIAPPRLSKRHGRLLSAARSDACRLPREYE